MTAGPRPPQDPVERPWRRPDASMTLLIEVMERPLDPGYAAAAAARVERPRATGRFAAPGRAGVLLVAVALGLGGVWAARELRAPTATGAMSARQVLVEEIRQRSAEIEETSAANGVLRAEIGELQESALGEDADALLDRSELLGIWSGAVAVQGPGLSVTLEDSQRAQEGVEGTDEERVQDFDLQVLVNGLWASGAEAVAVNGHRLTATTAIRTAGQAILVDLQPLVSPYRVEAIGDPEAMRTAFARTSASAHLSSLQSAFSIASAVRAEDALVLPGSTSATLRTTQPIEPQGEAAGAGASGSRGTLGVAAEGRLE